MDFSYHKSFNVSIKNNNGKPTVSQLLARRKQAPHLITADEFKFLLKTKMNNLSISIYKLLSNSTVIQ